MFIDYKLVALWCLTVYVSKSESSDVLRDTYCYGDSSNAINLVDITCPSGVIRIVDVIAAAKPLSLNCSREDHESTPADQERCCSYNATDCMSSYTGNTDSYYNCSGLSVCQDVPIVFQQSGCNTTVYPAFTNYLVIEYSCVSDGLLHGACTTAEDCIDNHYTVCLNGLCSCQSGYSEIDNICVEDGIPNGACPVDDTCNDDNAYCSLETNRCVCRSGYIEDNERCIKVSSTVQTKDYCFGDGSHGSNHINITCTSGVIYVKDILTGAKPLSYNCSAFDHIDSPLDRERCCSQNDSTDCIRPYPGQADAYYACSGRVQCDGIPVVTAPNTCTGPVEYPDYSNYLIIVYVCVPGGQVHGSCDESTACVDRNSECFDELCDCVDGFTDRDHICWEDGTAGVDCLSDGSCLDPNAVCEQSNNTCVCNTGHTLLDGDCVKDCNTPADCTGDFIECSDGRCACATGYSVVYGTCKKDGTVGGQCSLAGTCNDANAVCVANVCACKDGYSPVNGECKQDGSNGGVCNSTGGCTDQFSECSQAGVCVCSSGYQFVHDACQPDGCIGCNCEQDGDCTGTDTTCGPDSLCQCVDGYAEVGGICKQDGELDGNCLRAGMCTDVHAVCIDGICVCNDVTNYTPIQGTCIREDGYLNGECSDSIPCGDPNSYCVEETGRCVCDNHYTEVNGVCELGNTSSVTSCAGSSPYNTLVPDCDRDSLSFEVRTYNRSKRGVSGCQDNVDTYNHTYYLACCTQGVDDCDETEIGVGECSQVYYTVTEYVCLEQDQVVTGDVDGNTNGTDVAVVTPEGDDDDTSPVTESTPLSVYNCSVQASCQTDIHVYVLQNTLQKINDQCSCNISLDGDGSSSEVTCENPVANHQSPIQTVTGGFVRVEIGYRGRISGGFVILFTAVDRNAILTATCGLGSKSSGITTLDACQARTTEDSVLPIDTDGDADGTEVGIVTPGYNDSSTPNWDTEPSHYNCSVQSSCVTDIDVFVLYNTLEKVNGVCSCNVSISGNGGTTEVTCDRPRPSRYARLFTSSNYLMATIAYHNRIRGHFWIQFRAVHRNAILTLSCGNSAKPSENANIPTCNAIGTGDQSIESDENAETDDGSLVDITNPGHQDGVIPPTGAAGVTYQCSVQASCVTDIKVFVILNTLQKVGGVCYCNITVYGDAVSHVVDCDGPAADYYTPILTVNSGFSRVDIRYHGQIRGSFVVRFQAENKNARLIASCGDTAKVYGIQNLPTCSYSSTDGTSIEADDDDECTGSGSTITSPDYPDDVIHPTQNGASVYYCSVQASCVTNIEVFVLTNTLQMDNGVCSCNISLVADSTTSGITCEGPAANRYVPMVTVLGGFVRLDIRYNGIIYGRFAILFKAVYKYARLTAACGTTARSSGLSNLGTCPIYGEGGTSIQVHRNETVDDTDVSIVTPGYGAGGSKPTVTGAVTYRCSVQASCQTSINVFVLVNTLRKSAGICSCNISLTADGSTTGVTCDGPPQNRWAPILSTASGFVMAEIDYRSNLQGHFVIEFRAVDRTAVLKVGCGTFAQQAGLSNLGACPDFVTDESTIEVNENNQTTDTEVGITSPSTTLPGSLEFLCSVQASCESPINVFSLSNSFQEINGVCNGDISIIGSKTVNVTCDGPGANRDQAIHTEPSGFLRVLVKYRDSVRGEFHLKFKGHDPTISVTVACGQYAQAVGRPDLAPCNPVEQDGGSSSGNSLIIVIVAVVLAFLLMILLILCCLFRQKIRSRLCPQKKKLSIQPLEPSALTLKPVIEHATPMNTKFTGRPGDEDGASRMNVVDYMAKEDPLEPNWNESPSLMAPVFTRGREDGVRKTRFKRRNTIQEDLVRSAQINEEEEAEKEKKRQKKKKKALRKAKVGISAVNAFGMLDGKYRPLENSTGRSDTVHRPPGLYAQSNMAPPPLPFLRGGPGPSDPYTLRGPGPVPPGAGLPDFTAPGLLSDHPKPSHASIRLPPLPFQAGSAWKRAGNAAVCAGRIASTRTKRLDISSTDDPDKVEHFDME